jgi:SNF2 family DNA or RNA helicase
MQNEISDLFSVFRFLRIAPIDEFQSFKAVIIDSGAAGVVRLRVRFLVCLLNACIFVFMLIDRVIYISCRVSRFQKYLQPIMLRRLKSDIDDATGKPLVSLPPRTSTIHRLEFSRQEQLFYDELFVLLQSGRRALLSLTLANLHPFYMRYIGDCDHNWVPTGDARSLPLQRCQRELQSGSRHALAAPAVVQSRAARDRCSRREFVL